MLRSFPSASARRQRRDNRYGIVRFEVPFAAPEPRADHDAERTSQLPNAALPAPRRCALRRARARGPVRSPCGLRRAPDLVRQRPRHRASPSARSPAPSRSCPGSSSSSRPRSACAATCSARSAAGSAPRSTPVRSGCRGASTRWSARTSRPRSRSSMSISAFVLAVLAKGFAVAFGVAHAISIVDFIVVSVLGGDHPVVVVLVITVAVAAFCARTSWDLDNVAAPIVTAAGDSVTLPSLFLATYLRRLHRRHAGDRGARARCVVRRVSRRRLAHAPAGAAPHRERVGSRSSSLAGIVGMLAGLTIEKPHRVVPRATRRCSCVIPPFLRGLGLARAASSSARLAPKLHLGLVGARARRRGAASPKT